MMMLIGCSGKKIGISNKEASCLLLHDMSYPHHAVSFDDNNVLKYIDLEDVIITDQRVWKKAQEYKRTLVDVETDYIWKKTPSAEAEKKAIELRQEKIEILLDQFKKWQRIIPLHRRQILTANLVYEEICKD